MMMHRQLILLLIALYVNAQIAPNPLATPTPETHTPTTPPSLVGQKIYDLNTAAFDSLANLSSVASLGDIFKGNCKSIKYLAFRYGQDYVTTGFGGSLTLAPPTLGPDSPGPTQLFSGLENFDKSWSFLGVNGLYISGPSSNNFLNFSIFLGRKERFYVERHVNHVHIQSAIWSRNWWSISGTKLILSSEGGLSFKIEWYPDIIWPLN